MCMWRGHAYLSLLLASGKQVCVWVLLVTNYKQSCLCACAYMCVYQSHWSLLARSSRGMHVCITAPRWLKENCPAQSNQCPSGWGFLARWQHGPTCVPDHILPKAPTELQGQAGCTPEGDAVQVTPGRGCSPCLTRPL